MATYPKDNLRAHWKCLAACTLVSMCPFQYGIDFGIIGGLQAMPGFLEVFGERNPNLAIGWNIPHVRQQLISSLMILGAFISSLAAGFVAKLVGRKISIWIACLLCIVANILMMTTVSIGVLYFARFLIGLANGMFLTFSQLYLQECSPPKYRGLVIGLFQSWTSFGTLIGTIVDNFTVKYSGKSAYVVPLGIIYIVPGLVSIGLFIVPESPRWLMLHGSTDKARNALLWLRPNPDTVEGEITEIRTGIEAEKALASSAAVSDLFKNPVDRRRALLAVGGVSLQAASGTMYMISYGTYFFEMAHVGNAFENTCILTAVGVFAILVNSALITRYGRRRLFLISGMLICGVTQLIIALVYQFHPGTQSTGKVIVGVSVVYIIGYNGMVATYSWLCAGEFPSQRLRSYTFGLAAAVGFLGAWLATFTAPYFINPGSLNWGPKYGYIWTPSCLLGALWTWLYLPEVQNRKFEEIDEMFEARLHAHKFRTYQCVGPITKVTQDEKKEDDDLPHASHEEVVWSDGHVAAEMSVNIA